VLTVLTGALSVSLSLFKAGMLGYVAMDVAPPYQILLEGVGSVCLRLLLVGWAVWCRWVP
jgi:hypothetical protein